MEIDMRAKGCPNPNCDLNKKKIRTKPGVAYCPKCGSKVVYVCKRCYKEIPDLGLDHKICDECEAKALERKQAAVRVAHDAGAKVVDAAGGIAGVAFIAAEKVWKSEAGKLAGQAAKQAIKKIKK